MEETIKYLIALVIGTLISPLWTKFLNRNKTSLESNNLRSDECKKSIEIFEKSLIEMRNVNKELTEKVKELHDKNERTINYFNNKITELQDINNYQTKQIMHLDAEVKKCADGRKKATAKKKPVKKAVA